MRILLLSIAATSALALVGCNTAKVAQTPSATHATATSSASAQGKPALICASREVTGSRFPVKECHTAEEWADIRAHGLDSLGIEAQRHAINGRTN